MIGLRLSAILVLSILCLAGAAFAAEPYVEVNNAWTGIPSGWLIYHNVAHGDIVMDVNGFATIQGGIDNASSGGDVLVWNGTYDEQVVVSKPLTLEGNNHEVVIAPFSADRLTVESDGKAGILMVDNAGGTVTVKKIRVDGSSVTGFPVNTSILAGVLYSRTGGAMDEIAIKGMDHASVGDEYGILVVSPDIPVDISITHCDVMEFGGAGISLGLFDEANQITAAVSNNLVSGPGSVSYAQNGIQAGDNVAANIDSNEINNMMFAPGSDRSVGILYYGGNTGHANSNTVSNCDVGIEVGDSSLTASGNTVTGGAIGLHAGAFTANFDGGNYGVYFLGNTIGGSSLAGILAGSYNSSAILHVAISGNSLNLGPGSSGDGIVIGDNPLQTPAGSVIAQITGNIISHWTNGIRFENPVAIAGNNVEDNTISGNVGTGILVDSGVNAVGIAVHDNGIFANGAHGAANDGIGTLDASENWWGWPCEANVAGEITGSVLYAPWYVDAGRSVLSDSPSALPEADFTVNLSSGYAPLTVKFSDLSTGGPASITGRLWDFGDNTTSTATNPEHTYANPGTYAVNLTITTCIGSDSEVKTGYITVNQLLPPVASFSANVTTGLAPLTVKFSDSSSYTPTSWSWYFGDGMPNSTEKNPAHTFEHPGIYDVTLTASNAAGPGTLERQNYIMVTPPDPVPDFSATPTSGQAPLFVQFTDHSVTDIQTRLWDFGVSGMTSTDTNPGFTYNQPGIYTVKLTVTNATGSANLTQTDYITVVSVAPKADFTSNVTIGNIPLDVQFTDLSTGGPTSWYWDFGDGTNSTQTNPSHLYPTQGQYPVTLTVSNPGGTDVEEKPNYITAIFPPPVASFTSNVTTGPRPLDVQFTDTSSGNPTSWSWDFGDMMPVSHEPNPVHRYEAKGQYDVRLEVANDGGGDTRDIPSYITVTSPPLAAFTANTTTGTIPLGVQFYDTSTGDPSTWQWNFGDGMPNSSSKDPEHRYSHGGNFTVSLTVTNTDGSSNMVRNQYIHALLPDPVASFTASPRLGTVPLTVQFNDTSIGEPNAWIWYFGDGAIGVQKNPVHTYNAAGSYTVELFVFRNGLDSSVSRSDYITATNSPIADFTATPMSGTAPLLVQFSDHSQGRPFRWFWQLGDGSISIERNPYHVYTKGGSYNVSLTVQNLAGMNTTIKSGFIQVSDLPVADFSANRTSGLSPLDIQFSDKSTGGPSSWQWNFGDGSTSNAQNPAHTYDDVGVFSVKLIASNSAGSSTKVMTDYIRIGEGITADFTYTPASGAVPLTVQFTDESHGGPIIYLWNFGDGYFSDARSPAHTFTRAGTFNVTLTVSGASGASNVTKQVTAILMPKADFTATPESGTAPLTVQFHDLSTGDLKTWVWYFDDYQFSTNKSPVHTFESPGAYDVKLTVTDTSDRSVNKTKTITVFPFTP